MTHITGAVSFSVVLLLLCIAFFSFIGTWTGVWIYRRRTSAQPHWKGAVWGLKLMGFILPVLWLWFLIFWGIGYQRLSIDMRLGLDASPVTEEEVRHVEASLLKIIQRDQPKQPEDRNTELAIQSISNAMQCVVLEWDGIPIQIPERVKATPAGLLLMNGTSGMCVPFTLEPHVDGGLPDTAFVSVAAHELGHITGICDEGETNLLGYAAGLRAENPYARYTVALGIYRRIGERSREEWDTAFQRLPEQAQSDLKKAGKASERYRIRWFQQLSWRIYNQYLKSQGVKEGVKSYARGTQLLIRLWRAGHIALPELLIEVE
ncbi:MAG: DUF3810 family protein [Candidatus Hydrogenedentes bacterium]|nr:DUF3810 family protein [Candidatus Hydrogenedentota bacterium]